jgi:hypothetical protein
MHGRRNCLEKQRARSGRRARRKRQVLLFKILNSMAQMEEIQTGNSEQIRQIKTTAFYDVLPCRLVEVQRRFTNACRLHHQGDIAKQLKTLIM